MSRIRIALFFALQAIVAALFLNRSPYVMTSTAPTKQWADGPMKLVVTPQYQTKKVSSMRRPLAIHGVVERKCDFYEEICTNQCRPNSQTDLFTTGATHMCLLHNAIIRGFNTIYLQAPHIQDADKAAFIGYSQTWFRFVKSHHDDEEDNLFPKVQDLLGDEAVWNDTHEEHGTRFPLTPWLFAYRN